MGVDSPFLLALAASSLLPRKEKDEANEKKREAHWDMLFIRRGQDIGEEILTYFRNRSRSKNSNGHSRIGWIMSANGLVFHPILENSSTTAEGLYDMIRLGGRYTISEDGEVQQCGPLTIYCAGPSHVVYGGQVIGRLVAAEAVKVVVGSAPYNPSEDE
ncbi:AT-hook motif nuclear-localized protein 8-like [Capsicum annuum]|uniref:AT-hook motif nuclear-localized protein 8-like n=1 Tax=Capsicum annuum TaxID=4072 RepID=UPI001FB13505|nr:AT-hook motif nuclear-localized protein 8-like [Capsicum annuum]